MSRFTTLGNNLHSGQKSIDFVSRRILWYSISLVMILVALVGPMLRGGFVFGIEFTGGSEFVVSKLVKPDQELARTILAKEVPGAVAKISTVGTDAVRIQTDQVTSSQTTQVRNALAKGFDVPVTKVTASFIGATWGGDITQQAVRGLVIFLILVSLVMTVYFRTWKMALAALAALAHDLILTAGIYGITGFEITPAAVIGFLTILGYSLYDTVVVFDKVRENTARDLSQNSRTFASSVNLAVNQTLVRSINTSIVAILPVASILFIGAILLGAGTLRDISLALLVGIIVGTYSTIFIAAPLYAHLRLRETQIKKHDAKVRTLSANAAKESVVGAV